MNGRIIRIVSIIFLACTFLHCGSARKPVTEAPRVKTTRAETPPAEIPLAEIPHGQTPDGEILPESIASAGLAGSASWVRKSDVAVFAGESLFEYINGAAEMYHNYDFTDLSAAEYEKGNAVVTADVYAFSSEDMAFGMYTTLRPEEPDTVMIGIEGFAFDTNWIYVKGPYLVNVYTYDNVGMGEVRTIAAAVESGLRGTNTKPETFDAFPVDGRVPYSDKIYAEAFLSQDVLADVYTIDYARDGHRFTLFTSLDPGSAKLEAWRAAVEEARDPDMGYQHLPYDGSRYLHTSDSYRGEIIAGPIGWRLAGMVGYRTEDMDILIAWLHTLIEQP
jgi:hypothetical protein